MIGRTVSHYRIASKLGSGGMGTRGTVLLLLTAWLMVEAFSLLVLRRGTKKHE